ncbi:MAG: sulfatase [Nocardioidaceae bacterium]|nr:sulfatase [Nocardioidaceae bacterium]
MPRRLAVLAAVALVLAFLGLSTPDPAGRSSTGTAPAPTSSGGTGYQSTLTLTGDRRPDLDGDGKAERWERASEQRRREAQRPSVSVQALLESSGEPSRPNILVLMTDDMRDDDLRLMPNVRRLMQDQGVQFENAFAPQPLCCPARASFLTGQYTHNHGVWSHRDPWGFRVLDDRQTLPVWLQAAGYSTSFLGKYLNGYGRQLMPDGTSSLRYVPPGWTDWRGAVENPRAAAKELDGGTYRYFDTTLNDNGSLESHAGQYQTLLYSRITQQMIRARTRSPQPFFAHISFSAPHVGSPREPDDPRGIDGPPDTRHVLGTPGRPAYTRGRFDDRITRIPGRTGEPGTILKPYFIAGKPPVSPVERTGILEAYRQRAEALSVVDEEIANIFETLEVTGALDDTYVVLTSDNGFFLGEHRMRSSKILPYEPSLRVPLLIRGPGLPAGERRTDPFLMIDIAPTLLQAAGLAVPDTVDGVGLLDVARTGDRGWARAVLTDTGPRTLDKAAERGFDVDNIMHRPEGPSRVRFSQGVRTGRYLYVEHASREQELYDLRDDPRQWHNVVAEPRMRSVVRRLAQVLDRMRVCAGASCADPLTRGLRADYPEPQYVASLTR